MKKIILIICLLLSTFWVISARFDPYEGLKDNWIVIPTGPGKSKKFSKAEYSKRYDLFKEDVFNPVEEVKFFLYTRENIEGELIEIHNRKSLQNSNFNPANPTRVLIHGWTDSVNGYNVREFKRAFLQKGPTNCIGVDWSSRAYNEYDRVVSFLDEIGQVIYEFISFLEKSYPNTLETLGVVGNSLGAHLCGFVGKSAGNGTKPASIVAMDPSIKLFPVNRPERRVNKGDAKYVEVIHTCIHNIGIDQPIGDADFYPVGGGPKQPGCVSDATGSCAHRRSVELYLESITSESGLWAQQCKGFGSVKPQGCDFLNSFTVLGGEPVNAFEKEGIWWLDTNEKGPYTKEEVWDIRTW